MCESEHMLKKLTDTIIQTEGEGVILQKLGSFYERGRTLSLLKFKV